MWANLRYLYVGIAPIFRGATNPAAVLTLLALVGGALDICPNPTPAQPSAVEYNYNTTFSRVEKYVLSMEQ